MKFYLFLFTFGVSIFAKYNSAYTFFPVNGYHFHTLFLQNNPANAREADHLRDNTLSLIQQGYLRECIVGNMFMYPIDEYPVGNFVTCCNATAVTRALPWFAQNRGELSIFVHGLTRENLLDHKERGMWIGKSYPLDFTNTVVLRNIPTCVPSQIK